MPQNVPNLIGKKIDVVISENISKVYSKLEKVCDVKAPERSQKYNTVYTTLQKSNLQCLWIKNTVERPKTFKVFTFSAAFS